MNSLLFRTLAEEPDNEKMIRGLTGYSNQHGYENVNRSSEKVD